MLHVELQEGRDLMRLKKYSNEFGVMQAVTVRICKATAYCGQREIKRNNNSSKHIITNNTDNEMGDVYVADSYFSGINSVLALGKQGHNCIFAVKNNYAFLLKNKMEEIMKNYPAGAYLVFEANVEEIPLAFFLINIMQEKFFIFS